MPCKGSAVAIDVPLGLLRETPLRDPATWSQQHRVSGHVQITQSLLQQNKRQQRWTMSPVQRTTFFSGGVCAGRGCALLGGFQADLRGGWHKYGRRMRVQNSVAGEELEVQKSTPNIDLRELQLTMKGLRNCDADIVARLEQELSSLEGVEAVQLVPETESCLLTVQPSLLPTAVLQRMSALESGVLALPYKEHSWKWRGHKVAYSVAGCGNPLILVHGFGGCMGQYRKLVALLAGQYRVYALDLIGFGASDKPPDLEYNPVLWGQLLKDFAEEFAEEPCVLVGNSIGSLASLTAAANAAKGTIQGVILLNCPGGMNRKGIEQEEPLLQRLAPLFNVFEFLLKRPFVSNFLFDKFRSKANVKRILLEQVYHNKEAVTDELVDLLYAPSEDAGALGVFVSVFTGDPGPRPEALVAQVECPILVLWGEEDAWMPIRGPVGQFFVTLAQERDNVRFIRLPNVGHCPQDDRPELVVAEMLPWLEEVWRK